MHKVIVWVLATIALVGAVGPLAEASNMPKGSREAERSSLVAGAEKLVLAFYYAWFDDNTWRPEIVSDMPAAPYRSADRATITRHVDQAKGAGIDALVLSWLGPNNPTDTNMSTLLAVSQEKGTRAALNFETDSPFLGSQAAIADALKYAIAKYAGHPAFLRHQGKPVFTFWRSRQLSASAWQQVRDLVDPNHNTIWIAEGDDPSYLQAFDGIVMYSVAWSPNVANTVTSFIAKFNSWQTRVGAPRLWVGTVMPGYDDRKTGRSDAFARDRANGQYYATTWNAAMSVSPDWIMITSFNEWVEGSQIEPSVSYGDKYLNQTRDFSAQFKNSGRSSISEVRSTALDYALPNGHFYTQGNSQADASAKTGFIIANDDGVRFWDEYQRLGGVAGLGYPISHRFQWNGFVVQVMQKGTLQWQPEVGRAYLVNVFDQLSTAGKDDWLSSVRSVPQPLRTDFDAGKSWDDVVKARLALLEANPAIKQRYYAASDPLNTYGLPTSRVEDRGNHYVIRLQRTVFQQWKVDVPWAGAGQVIVANGGDVAKEAGLYASDVLTAKPLAAN